MKLPKEVRRYCKYCRKHTLQKLETVSSARARGALKRGSLARARLRGLNRGYGNQGKFSKPPISQWKRRTKKTKKTNLLYTCTECNKSMTQSEGIRTSKVEIKAKV
jgi:large subunit ribosomal protein L44e